MPIVRLKLYDITIREEFIAPEYLLEYLTLINLNKADEGISLIILWSILENARDYDQSFVPFEGKLNKEEN